MLKWRLMMTTLPVVALVVLARLVMEQVFGLSGWFEFSEISAVMTAAAFLIGFMLAGTMSDYKECEKLPSELITTLETIDDLIQAASIRPEFDAPAARRALLQIGHALHGWLSRRASIEAVHDAIAAMNPHFQAMDRTGSTAHANRSIVFMNAVRRGVGRMDVVSRTGFLPTGYAILEVMVVAVVVLLLGSRFKSLASEYCLLVCIPLIYVYMLRLIRDIDDPFDYGPDLQRRGVAEIDAFPLTEYLARGAQRPSA